MKKTLFISAAASLSMAMSFEEFRDVAQTGGFALRRRDDESADNSLYWVDNGSHTRYADDEAQDNNLIIDTIKNGYYTATNWALANPDKIYSAGNFIANGLMNPKWDDEELMAKKPVHEHKKKHTPAKNVKVHDEAQDNSLFWVDNKHGGGRTRYADDEAQDNSMFWVDNGYGGHRYADDEAQDNNLIIDTIKNGYYTATNWALANPDKIYSAGNFIANGLMNPKWDDEELMVKKPVHEHKKKKHTPAQDVKVNDEVQDNNLDVKNGYYVAPKLNIEGPTKTILTRGRMHDGSMNPKWDDEELMAKKPVHEHKKKKHTPAQDVKVHDEVQDNNLIINTIKNGYYTATNWALANPDKIYSAGNFIANGLMNPKWDDEELMVKKPVHEHKKKKHTPAQDVKVNDEAQDNNLVLNTIKNGYYTATNWALANPHKIYSAGNFIANGLMNPKWDDEELMARRPVHEHKKKKHTPAQDVKVNDEVQDNNLDVKNGYYVAPKLNIEGPTKTILTRGRMHDGSMNPKWDDEELMAKKPVHEHKKKKHTPAQDVKVHDEVQDNNLIINTIKNGYYTATNWALANPDKIYSAGNFIANGLMNPKWDDEELMVKKPVHEHKKKKHTPAQDVKVNDEAQDNNLVLNTIKNGYYTATNWALANPHKIYSAGNFIANGLMNPKWDDEELMARRPVQEKPGKPSKMRPIAQPQPEVQADNTLFELGNLIAEADN